MSKTHPLFATGFLLLGLLVSSPACVSAGYMTVRRDVRDVERRAYDNGFREGVWNGERDARDRREFRVNRSGEYRDADAGFRRGDGLSREEYRRVFRDGYEAGYREAFDRVARSYERDRPVVVVPPPAVRQDPRVVTPDGGYRSRAAQNGYQDGVEAGRNDARDRARFDPIRAKRYREGDHDYESRYGSRDQYKREYRAAFEQGYREGYGRR